MHSSADSRKVKENAKEQGKDLVNWKILTFPIEVYVSGITPRVNPSENSCRGPMESTFDEVGFQIKNLYRWLFQLLPKKMQSRPFRWSNPGRLTPKVRIMPLD